MPWVTSTEWNVPAVRVSSLILPSPFTPLQPARTAAATIEITVPIVSAPREVNCIRARYAVAKRQLQTLGVSRAPRAWDLLVAVQVALGGEPPVRRWRRGLLALHHQDSRRDDRRPACGRRRPSPVR